LAYSFIPALPFYQYQKTLQKPCKQGYPLHPQTIGEHIKKVRMEKGLLQKEVAELMGVSEDSITYWENDRALPQIRHYPGIIRFLEYYPFTHEIDSLAGKLQQLRHCFGHSYEQLGALLEVNASTIRHWELKKGIPRGLKQTQIIELWQTIAKATLNHSPSNNQTYEKESPTG
jgi:DNA-binding XRE family transcriptional regulator